VEVQVLRSAAQWSTGVKRVETSVLNGIIHLIENAKHYVYIENECFISNPGPEKGEESEAEVQNGVAHQLLERIVRAKESGQTFRLYVMQPLLPAFEGRDKLEEPYSLLHTLLHYTYTTISRGPNSLIGQLRQRGVHDWQNYVSFCAARTHAGAVEGSSGAGWPPMSEILYIHSKLMIVDDMWTMIGSANLNDRSLLGERDSEVCLLIKDLQLVSQPPKSMAAAGCYAHSIRTHLMKEYLGLLSHDSDEGKGVSPSSEPSNGTGESIDVSDPLSDSFFHGVWNQVAKANTRIYEEVGAKD